MRAFSSRMFGHRVRARAMTQSSGDSGGAVEEFGDPGPELPCRVRLSGEREGMSALANVAVAVAQVAFPVDPGVKLGDRLVRGAEVLRVLGPARARDADGVLWVVECEAVD